MDVADRLRKQARVVRGQLGARVQAVTPGLARAFGRADTAGALVTRVDRGSSAERGGLRMGDIVLGIGGDRAMSFSELQRVVAAASPDAAARHRVAIGLAPASDSRRCSARQRLRRRQRRCGLEATAWASCSPNPHRRSVGVHRRPGRGGGSRTGQLCARGLAVSRRDRRHQRSADRPPLPVSMALGRVGSEPTVAVLVLRRGRFQYFAVHAVEHARVLLSRSGREAAHRWQRTASSPAGPSAAPATPSLTAVSSPIHIAVLDDEAEITRLLAELPAEPRLPRLADARRRGAAAPDGGRSAAARAARPRPARRGRVLDRPPAARALALRPRHRHRPRRRGRQGRRPRGRRRRLRHQAVRPARAAGPHQGGAAAHARRRRARRAGGAAAERTASPAGSSTPRRGACVDPERQRGRADHRRVRPARRVRRARRPRPVARLPARADARPRGRRRSTGRSTSRSAACARSSRATSTTRRSSSRCAAPATSWSRR